MVKFTIDCCFIKNEGCIRHLTLWSLFYVAGLLELLPSSNGATDFATEVESSHQETLILRETHGTL